MRAWFLCALAVLASGPNVTSGAASGEGDACAAQDIMLPTGPKVTAQRPQISGLAQDLIGDVLWHHNKVVTLRIEADPRLGMFRGLGLGQQRNFDTLPDFRTLLDGVDLDLTYDHTPF